MTICELTGTVCQHCMDKCSHRVESTGQKGEKNDNSKTVCGASEKPKL